MSLGSAWEGERRRGPEAEEATAVDRGKGPGKQVRSGEPAPGIGSSGAAAMPGPRGDASAVERADDWAMTPELTAAMGLHGLDAPAESAMPVRRKAMTAPAWATGGDGQAGGTESGQSAGSDVDRARAGFGGTPASSFPHRNAIERSFGAPLPATAYTDEGAGRASAALGADGYALGTQVAFASPTPSLAVAAHEAAHVMQATSGVQLHGGGGAGAGENAYEAHADAVADRVVRGESATDLLAAGSTAAPAVRRGKEKKPGDSKAADALIKELQALIDGAVWKEIRKTAYPKESAPGIKRAKERKDGTRADLTGLGKITALEHFATAVKAVQKDWAKLKAPERVDAIAAAINAEMITAGVPKFLEVKAIVTEFKGSFAHGAWRFNLSQAMIDQSPLLDADAAELCNTALHEARHAEQAFLAARFAAGPPQNKTAAEISAEQGIPGRIATLAVAKKFDAATDPTVAALGKQMYNANVTDGGANQQISDDDYLPEMKVKRTEAEAALTDLKATPDASTIAKATTKRDELKAAIAEVERRYTLYRNIPYEADAHEVGDAAEQAFKGWP